MEDARSPPVPVVGLPPVITGARTPTTGPESGGEDGEAGEGPFREEGKEEAEMEMEKLMMKGKKGDHGARMHAPCCLHIYMYSYIYIHAQKCSYRYLHLWMYR